MGWIYSYAQAHFTNRTNNRLESFNQKLKTVLTRYVSLKTMFVETFSLIQSMNVEKQHRKIVAAEKQVTGLQNEAVFEKNYRSLLTNFAYSKLRFAIDAMPNVVFTRIEIDTAYIIRQSGYIRATSFECNCVFFNTMHLPCKHLLKYRSLNNIDLYDATLCHKRWKSKTQRLVPPNISIGLSGIIPMPSQSNARALTRAQKFVKLKAVIQQLTDALVDLPQAMFDTALEELKKCSGIVGNKQLFTIQQITQSKFNKIDFIFY